MVPLPLETFLGFLRGHILDAILHHFRSQIVRRLGHVLRCIPGRHGDMGQFTLESPWIAGVYGCCLTIPQIYQNMIIYTVLAHPHARPDSAREHQRNAKLLHSAVLEFHQTTPTCATFRLIDEILLLASTSFLSTSFYIMYSSKSSVNSVKMPPSLWHEHGEAAGIVSIGTGQILGIPTSKTDLSSQPPSSCGQRSNT